MNRSIVIFVALAVLIAHTLAIRTNQLGALAPPYDQAYSAYRVAHNLVFEGQWTWSPGVSGFDSYPSPLWVMVCAVAERISFPINTFVRTVGVIATAISLMFATRFHSNRTASVITPMFLAISGAMAAAAVNGTETAVLTALVTGAFLSFEHRHDRSLGLFLMLCGWTREEGWILVGVFLLMRLADRRRELRIGTPTGSLRPFVLPMAGFVILTSLRWALTQQIFSPCMLDLVDLRSGELQNGIAYVWDFFIASASPWLVIYCVWYLMRGTLSRTGKRGLIIVLSWCAIVVVRGGGAMPFSESMVPIFPVLLLTGQEGLIMALNNAKSSGRSLAISSILVAMVASVLVSFRATDIGPIPFKDFQIRWMQASTAPRMGFKDQLGRVGLDEQTQATQSLRQIAIFMRDEIDPRRSVLSPWPGSLAYISGLTVQDLTGRVTAAAPNARPNQSPLQSPVDVLAALENVPDYIIPSWDSERGPQTTPELAQLWLGELDIEHSNPARLLEIEGGLDAYEWITIPLDSDELSGRATLLRNRSLGLGPKLSLKIEDDNFVIQLEHHGHPQLMDLMISGVDRAGNTWFVNPTGRLAKTERAAARSNLLVTETGERSILLMRALLPESEQCGISELTIELLNPGALKTQPWTQVATPLTLSLP